MYYCIMFQTYDAYGYSSGVDYDSHMDGPSDIEYERQGYTHIPDMVKRFLIYFRNCINEGLIFEIQNLYEST